MENTADRFCIAPLLKDDLPLISCLCVTHQKPQLLARAISCFLKQSYTHKQLVIVYENIDHVTVDCLKTLAGVKSIKLIEVDSATVKKTLGELRNISVNAADGKFICQWDDDDWHHPERLSSQVLALLNDEKPASILQRWLVYDALRKQLYCSHKRLWEGSIMCRKDIFKLKSYELIVKGEDTATIDFLNANNYLSIVEAPYLYVYVYHSKNTWDYSHFQKIINCSQVMPVSHTEIIERVLENVSVNDATLQSLTQSVIN